MPAMLRISGDTELNGEERAFLESDLYGEREIRLIFTYDFNL